MELLKRKWQNLPLRRFFILTVCLSIGIVAILSAGIIWGCMSFRHWLLPDANAVFLTIEETFEDGSVTSGVYLLDLNSDLESLPFLSMEADGITGHENVVKTRYAIQKIENSFAALSPKRKLAYRVCSITMVAAPTILAFFGIIVCSLYFYRRKLKEPIAILSDAADKIAEQNLDFNLTYECGDEMGDLCLSFEKMRTALHENNKAMWTMLEERRLMQASVAHDLRNPIAIVKGYTEYLDSELHDDEIDREKACHIVQNLNMAAKRLEQYTESVRLLNQSEETRLNRQTVSAPTLAGHIAEDLKLLAEQNGVVLQVTEELPDVEIQADSVLLYRILENIINNALRYARKEICLAFSLTEQVLFIMVTDDGEGFSAEILKQKENTLFTPGKDGHMGIGLAVSRLLCKKHGGSLKLSNSPNGACVKINVSV